MKEFSVVVGDVHGIHARPAGEIVSCAKKFESSVKIRNGDKTADGKRLLAVLGLGARRGDTLTFSVEGKDESAAAEELIKICGNIK